jgi:hypothetical protein
MAVGIGLNNFGNIFRFNPDIGALDWVASGVFHDPFKKSALPQI